MSAAHLFSRPLCTGEVPSAAGAEDWHGSNRPNLRSDLQTIGGSTNVACRL